jgi:hypothetical protein
LLGGRATSRPFELFLGLRELFKMLGRFYTLAGRVEGTIESPGNDSGDIFMRAPISDDVVSK